MCKLENEAILRDFLNFSNLTTKTQQFCETSSSFELDNLKNETEVHHIKNEAVLRDFLQKCNVECRADGLVPMPFAFFSTPPV